jgi:hypothetical protein
VIPDSVQFNLRPSDKPERFYYWICRDISTYSLGLSRLAILSETLGR